MNITKEAATRIAETLYKIPAKDIMTSLIRHWDYGLLVETLHDGWTFGHFRSGFCMIEFGQKSDTGVIKVYIREYIPLWAIWLDHQTLVFDQQGNMIEMI